MFHCKRSCSTLDELKEIRENDKNIKQIITNICMETTAIMDTLVINSFPSTNKPLVIESTGKSYKKSKKVETMKTHLENYENCFGNSLINYES